MTTFTRKVNTLAELLEQQSRQTQNFAELELLILKATQDLGHLAATNLTPVEAFPPSKAMLSEMPKSNAKKRNSNSNTQNLVGRG